MRAISQDCAVAGATVRLTPSDGEREPFSATKRASASGRRDGDALAVALLRDEAHVADAVDVALHEDGRRSAGRAERALESSRRRPRAMRRASVRLRGLGDGLDGEACRARPATGGEAAAAHRDAVADARVLEHARGGDPEAAPGSPERSSIARDAADFFDDPAEHDS
jgi:hypothetical protein